MIYFRAIPQFDAARPSDALPIAGGWTWFTHAEVLERGRAPQIVPASEVPTETLAAITAPRPAVAGLTLDRPRLMGILNVTPDSFSDGGQFMDPAAAITQARQMAQDGADILDIGGESTRPGAVEVQIAEEIDRTAPVIAAIQGAGHVISIDTRKSAVGRAALQAGAAILNDVSAMTFDPAMADLAAQTGAPICLMHAQGLPETMQNDPRYDDVVLDVYDHLAERIAVARAAGIAAEQIITDPGIGFGKTLGHNLALLRRLSIFHSLGAPILLGASRKRFIGVISGAQEAADRMPGSVSVALMGALQGVHILRVHDTLATKQAFSLMQATLGS